MSLDPKTIEVWAGLRSLASMVSELQTEIADLRTQLSGFEAYQKFARSQESFDDLEANLQEWFADVTEVTDADVTDTVDLLRSNFTDWATYLGDSSSGLLSRTSYDDYRTYLTNNGVSTVDADQHIQLLKEGFRPDEGFAADASEHLDWDALETELANNGVSASSAETTVDRLRQVFVSVGACDRRILAESSWSDVETYLANNGLTSTEASEVVADLKTAYGSTLTSTVKDSFSGFDSYSELETYLVNAGFTSSRASTTITKLKDTYSSFDAFRTAVLSQRGALDTILSDASHSGSSGGGSETGLPTGIKIFEESGTTADGVSVPAGAISIRGVEVHNTKVDPPTSATASTTNVSYAAPTTSDDDNIVEAGEAITVSSEVTNNNADDVKLIVPFIVNSVVEDRSTVTIPGNGSRTVTFRFVKHEYEQFDVRIGTSSVVTIYVMPAGIST